MRAFIYQCRELPAADDDGSSDTFIQCFDNWQKDDNRTDVIKTRVVDDTVYPMFYECIPLTIEGDSREEMPPFVFDIYDFDYNVLVDTQDFMARCVIPVE